MRLGLTTSSYRKGCPEVLLISRGRADLLMEPV